MADPDVSGQLFQLSVAEDVGYEADILMCFRMPVLRDGDACALLSSVLKGVESVVQQRSAVE